MSSLKDRSEAARVDLPAAKPRRKFWIAPFVIGLALLFGALAGIWRDDGGYRGSVDDLFKTPHEQPQMLAVTQLVGFGAGGQPSLSVEYLIVGGGGSGSGAGASSGGGGGGGGEVKSGTVMVTAGSHAVVVGAGGSYNQSGIASSFFALTAAGGLVGVGEGGAGGASGNGHTGGAGGGGTNGGGGGGGGDSADGSAVTGGGVNGGNGGNGTVSSISGSSVTYGGGGAGAAGNSGANGTGGTGGGANAPHAPGTANTGGGGSGESAGGLNTNGVGGSGIVIIRYLSATPLATGGTITTSGGYQIHTFTTSGTFTY